MVLLYSRELGMLGYVLTIGKLGHSVPSDMPIWGNTWLGIAERHFSKAVLYYLGGYCKTRLYLIFIGYMRGFVEGVVAEGGFMLRGGVTIPY